MLVTRWFSFRRTVCFATFPRFWNTKYFIYTLVVYLLHFIKFKTDRENYTKTPLHTDPRLFVQLKQFNR